MQLTRSAKIRVDILDGAEALETGHEAARLLWNFTRYCVVSYNRRVQRWREGRIYEQDKEGNWIARYQSLAGRLPKYPGFYDMRNALRDHWTARELSDRCFDYTIKTFNASMKSWFSNLRRNPRARPPRYVKEPRQLTFEMGRNAKSLGDWTYRLTVLGGHIQDRHATVKVRIGPGIKMKQLKLLRVKPDGTGTVVYYVGAKEPPGENVAAVDLGIINLAALIFRDGTSVLYSGRGLLSKMQWYEKKAAKCKPSGWQGKGEAISKQSEQLKSYRIKAGNIRKLAVHNLTRDIIDECVKRGVGVLVIGDLTGIRFEKDHGKRGNQKLHAWPFAEIRRQLEYKAEEVGIEVVAISEAYTSKTCHFCSVIGGRVERGLFICRTCGVAVNADVLGAANLLKKYLLACGLGVEAILPGLPSPTVSASGIGKAGRADLSQIGPTFVAKFDLRNWSIQQSRCNGTSGGVLQVSPADVPVSV